jgi:hypothetical protein
MQLTLFAFLLSAVWPLVKKVMISMGVGIVSYAGLTLVATQIQNSVSAAWGQVGGVALQILSLAGIPESMGIILGGISAKAALVAIGKIGRVAT